MVVFRSYAEVMRENQSPRMVAAYIRDARYEKIVDQAFEAMKRRKLHRPWNESIDTAHEYLRMLIAQQRSEDRSNIFRKPYKPISKDYERPFAFPKWCRHLHDTVADFIAYLSSFTIEKWIVVMLLFYFVFIFIVSIFYPLYNAVRKDFLHPRFFIKSPRWFVDENWLHRRTKFVFIYNFIIILFMVGFLLFYFYGLISWIQYYDSYYYYRHMYQTVPFFEGGASRRNGGTIMTLTKKKRLIHPERGMPQYYVLLYKDRW